MDRTYVSGFCIMFVLCFLPNTAIHLIRLRMLS
jgi:hypothetical protein